MRSELLITALVPSALAAALVQPADAATSGVLFGSPVSTNVGESFAQAIAREDKPYGTLPISRVFYSGPVQQWPGKAGASGRPDVVSFKYAPCQVVLGTYDAALTQFVAGAPTGYDVWWSYIREPEDNIAKGEFTSVDYKAAWAHISALAAAAAPTHPLVHSTLILMCYTMNPASGRDWHNYYVDAATQSMLAFDCYNHAGKIFYGSPATDGSLRAAWLRSVGSFLGNQHAADPAHSILGSTSTPRAERDRLPTDRRQQSSHLA